MESSNPETKTAIIIDTRSSSLEDAANEAVHLSRISRRVGLRAEVFLSHMGSEVQVPPDDTAEQLIASWCAADQLLRTADNQRYQISFDLKHMCPSAGWQAGLQSKAITISLDDARALISRRASLTQQLGLTADAGESEIRKAIALLKFKAALSSTGEADRPDWPETPTLPAAERDGDQHIVMRAVDRVVEALTDARKRADVATEVEQLRADLDNARAEVDRLTVRCHDAVQQIAEHCPEVGEGDSLDHAISQVIEELLYARERALKVTNAKAELSQVQAGARRLLGLPEEPSE